MLLATTAGFITLREPSTGTLTSPAAASITLPLEVIGSNGYTVSVTVYVSDPASVARLYLQANNLAYTLGKGGKGSVRVNGGNWISLTNGNVTCKEPEASLGCIGGARSNVRLTLPVSGFVKGNNTLSFRFNGTDGFTAGYRILALNLQQSNGSNLLSSSVFAYDDPSTWQPPRNTQSDINAGRDLWHNAKLVLHPGGPRTQAACADCHFQNGEDLAYFAYSNRAIIERSKFHSLSQQQAEQIASYIRSLDVQPYGRPWDPPFQPGPGLSRKPADAWMAGAGLSAVLDRDEDMPLPEQFDLDDRLSNTDLPIAMELLDWNAWLPRVYPGDAFGSAFFSSDAYAMYTGTTWSRLSVSDFDQRIGVIAAKAYKLKQDETNNSTHDADEVDAMLGLMQWAAVKTLEVSYVNDMFDKAPQKYGADGAKRSVLGQHRNFFNLGPHILTDHFNSDPWPYGSPENNDYKTAQWYTIQLLTNDGNKANPTDLKPIDWKYQYRFLQQGDNYDRSVSYPHLYVYSMVKQWEQGYEKAPSKWYWRHATLGWLFDSNGASRWPLEHMNAPARAALLTKAIRAFNEKLYRHAPSEWPRGGDPLGQLSTSGASCQDDGSLYQLINGGKQIPFEDHFYAAISDMVQYGVDPYVADSTRDYAAKLWPGCDWARLMPEPKPSTSPKVSFTSPSEGAAFAEGSDIALRADASDGDGSVVKVVFFADGTRLGEDASAPYGYTWRSVSAGDYTLTAKATDDDGKTSSATRLITVKAPDQTDDPPEDSPPATASVLWLKLNESSGTRASDASGTGNDGTLEGGPRWTDGRYGNALYFDGQDDHVIVDPSATLDLSSQLTLMAWFKNDTDGGDGNTGVSKHGAYRLLAHTAQDTYQRWVFDLWDEESNFYRLQSTSSVSADAWHHVAATYDGRMMRLYVDGALSGSREVQISVQTNRRPIELGRRDSRCYAGWIDEVRLYNRALSASEIKQAALGEAITVQSGAVIAADALEAPELTATLESDAALLSWQGHAGARFAIEQERETGLFETVAELDAGTEAMTYRVEALSSGSHRFRVKEIGEAGTVLYSEAVEVTVELPGGYALSGAYPNPFNPRTQFTLELDQTQHVALTVYDVLGRQVEVLHDGALSAQTVHRFGFEGSTLPSGTYVLRAKGETFTTTRTMVLLK